MERLINDAPFSRLQRLVLVACLSLAIIDGFNSLSVGFVIPALSEDWAVNPGSLSVVIVASLIGEILAALTIAPLADRAGRRAIVGLGVSCFAVFTLMAAFAQSVEILMIARFCAGLGIGAATPNLIALGAEYSPERARATVVTTIGLGLAGGGFLGGFVAGYLIPPFGWRSIFIVSGVLPLVLLVATLRILPESVEFLAARKRYRDVAATMSKISMQTPFDEASTFTVEARPDGRAPFREIFVHGRALATIMIWAVMFFGLLVNFFIFGYMPTVLTTSGLSQQMALFATSTCTFGGMAGGVLLGVLIDRTGGGYRNLFVGPLLALAATVLLVLVSGHALLVVVVVFAIGFGAIGTQICANAWAAALYPAHIRSTGVGWALGVGRVGGILGPVLGGVLLSAELPGNTIFLLSLIPSVIVGALVFTLSRLRPISHGPASPRLR
ncbi:aromatic acid/H+ symport family MFS transporter [Rhodococcus olei]|uniref:Aromatic acid/H+ symport family MFS transporter n=1 Tax=Rhodococcus olei TaxID=2161675 RepID=A0ABP8PR74_9NOCA